MAGAQLGRLDRPRTVGPHVSLWAGLAAGGAAAFAAGSALAQEAAPAQLVSAAALGVLGVAAAVMQLRRFLVAALLLLVSYVPDTLGGHSSAHALIAMALAAALLRSVAGRQSLAPPRELLVFVPLLVACLVATVFAEDPGTAAAETLDLTSFVVVVALLMTLLDSPTWLRRAAWAVAAGIGLLAVLAIAQQLTKSFPSAYGGLATVLFDGHANRSAGPLNPNTFGQVLATAAVLAFYLSLMESRRPARMLDFTIAAVCVVALFYTQSRAALIALLIAVIMIGGLRGVSPQLLAAGVCAAVVLGMLVLPHSFRQRVGDLSEFARSNPASLQDTSLRGRTGENLAGLRMWLDHPLIGVGPNNFEVRYPEYAEAIGLDERPEQRSAHNLYLEALAETGLLGALPFFALIGLALAGGWRARSRLPGTDALLGEGLFVALTAFLICAMTLNSAYARYEWIFLGLGLTAGRLARRPAA